MFRETRDNEAVGFGSGVSGVSAVLMMAVITVLLAVTVYGVFSVSFGGSNRMVAADISLDSETQRVEVTNTHGDAFPVSKMRVSVELPGGGSGSISGLPVSNNCLSSEKASGAVDGSCGSVSGSITLYHPDTDGVWSVGDSFEFRIQKGGEEGMDLVDGDVVQVTVVDVGGGGVVFSREAVAE